MAILYLAVSSAWILLSDRIVLKFTGGNIDLLQKIQSIKGIVFVFLCSGLLYLVSRRYYRDISKALSQTREMLHRYEALGEASKDGISDCDLLNDCAIVNEQMKFFMQEPSNQVKHFQLKHRKRIHPDDLDRVMRNFKDTLATSSTLWQADFRYLLYDGTYHDVINRGFIIRDANERPLRIISAIQDVSELRNIRTAIYHQEVKHQRMLSQSIIEAQEQERNRWATELHDNVCQILTVVKLYLEQVSTEHGKSLMLQKAGEMTANALNDIRQLSASIRPPEFRNTTVRQALAELLANVQRVRAYRIDTDFKELNEDDLKDEQKTMIYRVVQEQLNNIIKYAGANLISIKVKTEDDQVIITVADDGRGFDPAEVSSGIGLKNIRSRLQVFSGSMELETAPGRGCSLNARFSRA